jgi:hypothetical protein
MERRALRISANVSAVMLAVAIVDYTIRLSRLHADITSGGPETHSPDDTSVGAEDGASPQSDAAAEGRE